jgi:hypothetical protein
MPELHAAGHRSSAPRRQPRARHQGTTARQPTPVNACRARGQVRHEATLAAAIAPPDAPSAAP